jgi:hypothetical protein
MNLFVFFVVDPRVVTPNTIAAPIVKQVISFLIRGTRKFLYLYENFIPFFQDSDSFGSFPTFLKKEDIEFYSTTLQA